MRRVVTVGTAALVSAGLLNGCAGGSSGPSGQSLPTKVIDIGLRARGRRDLRTSVLTILPKQHQVTGQLPLLVAMIAFTLGGLYLLFSS